MHHAADAYACIHMMGVPVRDLTPLHARTCTRAGAGRRALELARVAEQPRRGVVPYAVTVSVAARRRPAARARPGRGYPGSVRRVHVGVA